MTLMTILLFIPASFALNMAPGPNNLLSMANAKRYGVKAACYAGIGRLVAFVGMITLAATGLATVLYTSEKLFLAIKIVGGFYLLWLAFQLWTADPTDSGNEALGGKSLFQLARQEFFLAAGNPKAILIFTAFLPQFVDPAGSVGFQFFILGALFLMLEWVAIAAYALFGKVLRHWFSRPVMRRLFNRTCAGLLGSAGGGLLLARRQ
ncbi:LysE family translocator [Aidingimonas halophila]|uniref:Threonine/homoserine/homoserine lactone efflux protein n=1 Tax=Aidingimonas halophila TaxID=574349 RepID=A0A1H3A5G5_9GAMM|nr:LysE family translocator [Aidingimonas halophila]GHC21498.1 lysine transporter LysE [Aidingimonas halophila]SDX24149.1 Threonine/homoserine/homoserine lactone efflux protein [Aidingimonas halophila]